MTIHLNLVWRLNCGAVNNTLPTCFNGVENKQRCCEDVKWIRKGTVAGDEPSASIPIEN
jgi:hypothetical protein